MHPGSSSDTNLSCCKSNSTTDITVYGISIISAYISLHTIMKYMFQIEAVEFNLNFYITNENQIGIFWNVMLFSLVEVN
jgi:hypothetical protein